MFVFTKKIQSFAAGGRGLPKNPIFNTGKKRFGRYLGLSPHPVRVTTRIITFLVGNPYKPSFPLLLGGTTQEISLFLVANCNYPLKETMAG